MKKRSHKFTIPKFTSLRAGIIAILLIPVLNFYLLEGYTHSGMKEVRPYPQLFNILLLQFLFVMLFLIFARVKVAARIETIMVMLLGLVNYYVYTFRSTPLVPWDIFSIRTAASVAGNYNFLPDVRVMVVLFLFILLLLAEGCFDYRIDTVKYRYRLLVLSMVTAMFVIFCHMLQQEKFQDKYKIYRFLFTPTHMWQVNGLVLNMVVDLPYTVVEKPSDYSEQKAEEILKTYENTSMIEDSSIEKPDIIVVMDEAFSDLSVLGELKTNQDVLPFYQSLTETKDPYTLTGNLNVSVCGGNTANTEFEFLSGHSMAFYPQGSIPYQQYIKNEVNAVPNYLKTMGYRTIAMHPYYASGWDRERIYPLLGFEESYFLDDFRPAEYIRDYVSDETCVDKIEDLLSDCGDEPVFLFQVTMQNHGSYQESFDNFTPDTFTQPELSKSLNMYLSLIHKTDEQLERLVSFVKNRKRPTLLLFFGDHQPNNAIAGPVLWYNKKDYSNLSTEDTKLRYQVPYVMYANFSLQQSGREDTSANYLALSVLQEAGLPLDSYLCFLAQLKEKYPVISAVRVQNNEGEELEFKEMEETVRDEYQILQYYRLFKKE